MTKMDRGHDAPASGAAAAALVLGYSIASSVRHPTSDRGAYFEE